MGLTPDIGFVYPKTGLTVDLRFDTAPRFVSTGSAFFDDTDDFVNCGDHANSQMTTGNFSVVYWAKTTGTEEHFCVSKQDGASDYDGYRFGFKGDGVTRCSLQVDGSNKTGDVDGTAVVNDGVWHHFAFTIDRSSNLLCYVDGQLDKTTDISSISGSIDPNEDLILGASYSGANQNFGGCLCNVGIYKGTVLTQAQVRSIMLATSYTATAAVVTPSLYYLLDDDYNDSTGNQNGTNNGSVLCGDRARLPNGFDLTGNRLDADSLSGRAIDLDGTGDRISMGHPDDLDGFFNTGGTISMWINMTSTTTFDRVFDFTTGTFVYLHGSFNGYNFNKDFTTTDGAWVWNGNGGVSLGEWFHWCLSYDASSTSNNPDLYINGVLQTIDSEVTPVGSARPETNEKRIGSDASGTGNLDASLAHIKFITSTVTAAQALEMCNNPEQILPTGIATSALKAWLPCSDFAISPSDNSLNGMFAQDASGNGNHGTLTNCGMVLAQPTPCPQLGLQSSSSRIFFDQTDDLVTVGNDAAINGLFGSGGSISVWMMPFSDGEGSFGRIVETGSGGFFFLCIDESGSACKIFFSQHFDGNDGSWKTSSTDLTYGVWNHVVITYDGSSTSNDPIIYVNGSAVSITEDVAPTGTINTDANDKLIGNSAAQDRTFDGIISNVAFFKNAILDADAVAAIYAGGIGFDLTSDSGNYDNSSSLAGAWVLDNPVTIQDLSANSNTGTVSGSPNMATVPEGSTADLSVFGKLTTTRLGSNVLALPPVGTTTDALGGYAKISNQPAFGTQNFTIAIWAKCESFIATYPYIFNFAAGSNSFGVRCFVVNSSGVLQFNYEGASAAQTGSGTVSGLFGKWTFIVFQRLGAASFTMKARLIDAASYAFTTNKTVDVGDMTESGPSYLGSFKGASNSSNGAIACPRVYLHGSSSAFSEAELNAIFEQGKRLLIGDS